nr:light-harvesting complex-like protein OHP2, chloroplastic [Quercus suber]
MSVTSSFPCIKIPTSSPSSLSSCSSASSSSPSSSTTSSYSFRFCSSKPTHIITIRSSQTEGPLRRPVVPSVREPSPPPGLKPTPPTPPPTPSSSSTVPKPAVVVGGDKNVITLEFQRQRAKELQDYFKQKKLEEADQGPPFGFIGKNEITNGRWAMFGFAVGMLTEYATGSDFVDQVKILLSNFGIIDLE